MLPFTLPLVHYRVPNSLPLLSSTLPRPLSLVEDIKAQITAYRRSTTIFDLG